MIAVLPGRSLILARGLGNLPVLCLAAAIGALLAGAALAPAPAAARTVSVGAYISGADENPALIDNFNSEVGRQAAVILTYKDWSQAPFALDQLEGIWNHGAVPMVTWEPWDVSLRGIAQGDYDGYVRDAAQAAAAWNRPLMIRFAPGDERRLVLLGQAARCVQGRLAPPRQDVPRAPAPTTCDGSGTHT